MLNSQAEGSRKKRPCPGKLNRPAGDLFFIRLRHLWRLYVGIKKDYKSACARYVSGISTSEKKTVFSYVMIQNIKNILTNITAC